jgi:hypothetical protein
MVHAWLVVCTRSGSRRRSSFRLRCAASPAHPGGCPTCAGRTAAVRPALRGHAGLWAGLAAKPAPFVWPSLGLYAVQGGAKRGQAATAKLRRSPPPPCTPRHRRPCSRARSATKPRSRRERSWPASTRHRSGGEPVSLARMLGPRRESQARERFWTRGMLGPKRASPARECY